MLKGGQATAKQNVWEMLNSCYLLCDHQSIIDYYKLDLSGITGSQYALLAGLAKVEVSPRADIKLQVPFTPEGKGNI